MLISETYRQLNTDLHRTNDNYGANGHRYARYVQDIVQQTGAQTVLDYGCGKGTLAHALPHLLIRNYDPALPQWSDPPEPADLVVCGDVLEHIEPECLDGVLDDLKRVTRKAALLVVATRPAKKTLADGRNAHLIQEPSRWWLGKILSRFDLWMFQKTDGEFSCVVKA